ncbi:MAG: hypothetical protein ACI9NY_000253 [Kiritimatiellia bacterium]|jgi:hypothetical protein
MTTSPVKIRALLLILSTIVFLTSCGVKVKEKSAHYLMEKVYQARKSRNFRQEFSLYAKKDFKIVPFEDIEYSLRAVVSGAGRFKSAKHLSTNISRRNQLGEGLVKYMVLSYEATYAHVTINESYYFLGESETPKIVYMTLQF